MPTRARFASLWRTLFRRTALDRELDDELRATFDLIVEREIAAGRTPDAARRAARIALGGPGGFAAVKADVRDHRVGNGLDTLRLDVRQGWRSLRHAPRLTAIIVATLAVGIGATAAIFSIVRALLIEPLPYARPDRLVFVWLDGTRAGYPRGPMSGPDLHDLREASRTMAAFGAIWATGTIALAGGDQDPEQLRSAYVTANFFEVLGATSALGRTFRPEDSAPGAHPTILLGWDLFTRRFGGDRGIVGREILVDEQPTTVIGVMPPAFRLLLPPDSSVPDRLQAWQPFWSELETGPRGNLFLRVVGRMRPGVDVAQARADVDAIAADITRSTGARRRFTTVGLQDEAVRDLRGPVLVLFAGVGVLLTIAGVNVAGLLVARAASRRQEIALRLALGAGLVRLLRQALVEGLALTGLGAIGGLAVGYAGLRALLTLAPEPLARIRAAQLDAPVVAFTLALAVAWGLLFTLAPLGELLRAGTDLRGRLHGRTLIGDARYRVRAALVVLQVGLSLVLLVGAGLLGRTFVAVQYVDPGFGAADRLTLKIALPESRYQNASALATADRELRRRLAAIPGVHRVAAISHLPYDTLPNWALRYAPDGTTSRDADSQGSADTRSVTPGLLETLGVQVAEGRTFTEDDGPLVPLVVIDDMLARRLWPGQRAVGRTFLAGQAVPDRRVTVVGVVRHLRQRSLVEDLTPQIFLPYRLWQRSPMAYVFHADRDPAALAVDARAAIAAFDPRLPIADVRPLAAFVESARATRRFTMQLAAAFAAAALALTCLGVYGVVAYAVAVRQRDIGVRRALGADTRRVVGEVLREGLGLALVGAAGGLAVAALAATLLRGLLYGVEPRDPVSFGVGFALVVAGAMLACLIPAWRAASVSPMEALRGE